MSLKKAFISGSYTAPPPPTVPRDYYISENGTGDGLTSGTPAPISVLTSAELIAGDNIFFNRGDNFHFGNFNISNLTNIDIGAFGTGADPIILGSTYIGGQTFIDNGDGTWYIPLADAPKWVTEGDVLLRFAESSYIPITVNVSAQVRRVNAATINALPGSIVGATMMTKEYAFRVSESVTVTAYNSGTGDITFVGGLSGSAAGMPILLRNQKQFMTLAGDWWYDDVLERLYIKSTTTPTGRDIRIITYDYGIKLSNGTGITIDGIEFKHFQNYAVGMYQCTDVTINNSTLHAIRNNAIFSDNVNANINLTIDSVDIHNVGLVGLDIGRTHGASITNTNIYDIGLQLNLGYPWQYNRTGGTAITPSAIANDIIIDHCNLYNLGYQGIQLFGNNWQVTNNVIHDFCKKWSDGGGIHLYYANVFASSTANNLIQNNLIYNSTAVNDGIVSGGSITCPGIYFDSGINNNTADSNIVYNTGTYNIYCNFWNTGHIITNNIVFADSYGITIQQNTTPSASYPYTTVSNCVLTGNILASTNASARGVSIISWNGLTTFNPFSSVNNNHYVNPYSTNVNRRSANGSAFTQMTLSDWQTYIAGDGSGTAYVNWKGGAPDADDILLETNLTDSPVNFNTPAGYKDYTGTIFTNPVSIPARYGLPYFQN